MKLDFTTDTGIGTDVNFGLIVLQEDETLEHELALMLKRTGVAIYHSRIVMPADITPETLASMEQQLPISAGMLPSAGMDVIGYGCTSGATVIGPEGVACAIQRAQPDAKVTDPITATMAALHHLGARRVGFVTPYVADVSAAMRGLLEANGFEIAGFGSFEEGDDRVVARISPTSIREAILTVADHAECDAVFVSCTNLRVAEIAAEVEAETGMPVVSSNLALGWHMATLAGLQPNLPELGRLFTGR